MRTAEVVGHCKLVAEGAVGPNRDIAQLAGRLVPALSADAIAHDRVPLQRELSAGSQPAARYRQRRANRCAREISPDGGFAAGGGRTCLWGQALGAGLRRQNGGALCDRERQGEGGPVRSRRLLHVQVGHGEGAVHHADDVLARCASGRDDRGGDSAGGDR